MKLPKKPKKIVAVTMLFSTASFETQRWKVYPDKK